ncbi:glycosyltransferase family 4 protein [Marinobacter halotolerans]|uniref:glycosyltransferase family 4 protein n=1 Tax=Marinobacter halotolerans TaxID=1569211 RepID=UPI0012451D07
MKVTAPSPAITGQRHITIVSETFPPEVNGVANTLRYLCEELVRRGHYVSVVRPGQKQEDSAGFEATPDLCHQTLRVTGLPIPGYSDLRFGLSVPGRLTRLWRKNRPDAVYVATQGPLGVSAVSAARRLGIPVSSGFHTNFHSYSQYYGAGWLEALLCRYGQWFHNRTAVTLVPTRKTMAATQSMGINPVALWSRGVDCNLFSPAKRSQALRESWGLNPGDTAILYVGRLAAEKNLQLAVSCFERLKSLHPTARFVLVGDGPMRQRLAERHPDYLFTGIQRGEQLAEHYASGDLFLFPSKTDTFGNVVTEAMASGLAVVAFDDAAAREHIRHGDNGMKASLEDSEAFVSHALRLIDQPTFTRRIRTQARLDALDLDWATQVERFENLVINQPAEARHHVRHKQVTTV